MRAAEILLERTLYHGTLLKNVPEIMDAGLIPGVGEFTARAYDEVAEVEPLPELVFAADKEQLRKCVSAILGQMEHAGIRVTPESFRANAALLIIRDGRKFTYRDEFDDGSIEWQAHPSTVEPGDYYSDRYFIKPDAVLSGSKLISFLRRRGVLPVDVEAGKRRAA